MLASKDFGFMLTQGVATMLLQLFLLRTWADSLSLVFSTFTLRLGSYAVSSLLRAALGYGKLGAALRGRSSNIFKRRAINGASKVVNR
jgi:hypothetical protein